MMRAAPLLLSAICFAALLPRNEATALFPAMKKRLALAQQKAETVEPPKEAAVPESVLDPVDVGADGFPKLPEVSDILGESMKALKTVDSQARAIELRVVQAQKKMKGKLARQKAAFEFQLKRQETQNLAVAQEITKIQSEVSQLETRNFVSRTKSQGLQKSNHMLRDEMHELGKKLGVARSFAFKTVFATDDSKEPTLNVLKVNEEQKQVVQAKAADDDDSDDTEDDDDVPEKVSLALKIAKVEKKVTPTSLLQTAAHAQKAASSFEEIQLPSDDEISASGNPDDLLKVLTKDVARLASQEKECEKNLKDIFIRDFRAGAGRHKALLVKQAAATKQRTDAQALEQQLLKAVSHLNDTHLQLTRRLHGVAQFMKQLEHLANAKESEVPELIEDLPKKVTLGKHVEQMPKPLV